ncbi:signal peptidase II [Methylicorpusculum sp.]|uniref:signal peptidase II n=1 Tax=Methylicorpusculum sp. TaxID=2713644 RepID=UPI002ABB6E7A|nr:signal peptidase II [Methylicorpusculum sp.]MDZ4151728.1 signal peptidase II [Methylicorpusculum sp.]
MKYSLSLWVRGFFSIIFFFLIVTLDRVTKVAALIFLGGAAEGMSGATDWSACTAGAPCCLSVGGAESVFGPCISFDVVFNRGVSWGLFASDGMLGFVLVAILIGAITGILAYYTYTRWHAGMSVWAELLILAGSVSNLIDRVLYHGVIDFIRLSWGSFAWPIFNIADCCIVLGVFFVFIKKLKDN